MNPESKPGVSLDTLLKLKRAERPAPEFWAEFDRELRAKQLAAIMARPPVWDRITGAFRALVRHPVPIGAAGAVAIAWVSVHEFRSAASRSFVPGPSVTAPGQIAVQQPAARAAGIPALGMASVSTPPAPEVARSAPAEDRSRVSEAESTAAIASAAHFISGEMPAERLTSGWNGRGLLATSPTGWNGASVQTVAMAVSREPLARMEAPAEDLRTRLLDDDLPSAASAYPSSSASDRPGSRLSDERLYQTIRRYGVGGDHLLIKF